MITTKHEEEALGEAIHESGQVIEAMIAEGYGSDFATWPGEAYEAMIKAAIEGYTTKLSALAAGDEPPF